MRASIRPNVSRFLEVIAAALAGGFLIGGVALAEPDKQCTLYGSFCTSFTCMNMNANNLQCTSGNVKYPWTNLTQTGPTLLGTCSDGTGDCSNVKFFCMANKYQTANPDPVCDIMTLQCLDTATRIGCQ